VKTNSVIKKLGVFGFTVNKKGEWYFWTRNDKFSNRQVKVVDQDGRAIALPLFVDKQGNETVVFHAKTIKSLVNFLKGGVK
jgi:hypothetical protein